MRLGVRREISSNCRSECSDAVGTVIESRATARPSGRPRRIFRRMRVLIIGGGGREHAIAWRLSQDDPSLEVLAAPGNPGIADIGECVRISALDLPALEQLAHDRAVDLTVVGPEAPLAAGIVDRFRDAGLLIFGPTRAAAEIETSKAFAKQLMLDDGIPTARAETHRKIAAAKAAARRFGAPVVIKASGLASGKGVIVCSSIDEADAAIDDMLSGNRFGEAGHEVLVEEFMEGEELSVFAITNGVDAVILPGLQDHKRLLDRDLGPNTGGMGAYLPVQPDRSSRLRDEIAQGIIYPTLRGMARRGRPFTGLLYAGLMLTREGPRVVEFNCRFGDPETQALMPVLECSPTLLELIGGAAAGAPLSADVTLSGACVTTVIAAANYPETPRPGDPITLPASEDGIFVFHAGTARDASGRLVSAGGRVLAVTARGNSVRDAQRRSLDFAQRVGLEGKQLRSDIGWREIARTPGN